MNEVARVFAKSFVLFVLGSHNLLLGTLLLQEIRFFLVILQSLHIFHTFQLRCNKLTRQFVEPLVLEHLHEGDSLIGVFCEHLADQVDAAAACVLPLR